MAKTVKYPHRIEFRATAEEYRLAEQLASQCDLTLSDLFRSLLKQAASTDPARNKTLIAHYQELGQIYKNLVQLKSCSQHQVSPTDLQSNALNVAAELINEVRKSIVQLIALTAL
jgi:hypothetical protein